MFYNHYEYAQQTKRLSIEAIKIRSYINSKDPEKTFFEGFPSTLSISINALKKDKDQLQQFTIKLQDAVRELRTSYDNLIQRFEEFICNEFMEHLSLPYIEKASNSIFIIKSICYSIKNFIQRIDSQLDDKKSWLNSIAQATVGKTLESFNDEDEVILYINLNRSLLNLTA